MTNSATHRQRNRQSAVKTRAELCRLFPACFVGKGQPKRPLKIGIYHEIRLAAPHIKARALHLALGDYTSGPLYLKSLMSACDRISLDGSVAGAVSVDAAEHAKSRLAKINRACTKRRELAQDQRAA